MVSVAVIILCAVLFSFGLRIKKFQIAEIVVEGETVVPPAKIVALANSILDTKYLLLFSQRNTLFYPRKTIVSAVIESFDRILSAELDVARDNTLIVHVADRKPYATWCGSVKVPGAADCYFIDAAGRIFASAPYFSGTAFIKYYGVVAGEPVGAQLLDQERFGELGRFILSLRDLDLEPQDVVLGPAAHEVYFRGGSKIIFNPDDPFKDIFENLKTVLSSAGFANRASSTHPFEYIDLRFDNRVFYK